MPQKSKEVLLLFTKNSNEKLMKKGGQAHEHRNDSGIYRSGGMERRIHSGIYWRAVPEPEAEERFKEEKEPVHKRGELWE